MRIAIGGIALALACFAAPAGATSTIPVDGPPTADGDDFVAQYKRQQRERFELLRSDGSPRVQMLAGRIYLDDDDPANKLLPKREDVIARAVQLAPDDALVQWFAADLGNYGGSACGPTRRPEAEVANLVRLEPDNAAAWQYAVALAGAKGDAAQVDEALSHMAASTRARDHQGEVAALWTKLDTEHPELLASANFGDDADGYESPRPSATTLAFLDGLQQASRYAGSVDGELESACKPDAGNDTAWQRLGWCVRAGELLTKQGNSFALRETGLKMLAAAGASPDDLADLRRNLQWLSENAAAPTRNPRVFGELDTLVTDWKGASDEIVATQNRLKRLDKPPTPPAGWIAEADKDRSRAVEQVNTSMAYLGSVIDDLRASADVRERALGLSLRKSSLPWTPAADADEAIGSKTPQTEADAESGTALTDLAAANPGNAFVQWIAANRADADAPSIGRVQRMEPDNAAAWLLGSDPTKTSAEALHRAAAATRFQSHTDESTRLLYDAFKRHPLPVDLRPAFDDDDTARVGDPEKAYAFTYAISIGATTRQFVLGTSIVLPCRNPATADAKGDCIKVARLLLNSPTSILDAMIGASTLRNLDALDGADRERARTLEWWGTQLRAIGSDTAEFVDDYLATGNEIEAVRRTLKRAGKAEPPADWQPPQWKNAAATRK